MTESPYGRSLRAMRDNDIVADSLGKNLLSLRATMLVVGGALAALSGAILVGFIDLWAPSAEIPNEDVVTHWLVPCGSPGWLMRWARTGTAVRVTAYVPSPVRYLLLLHR